MYIREMRNSYKIFVGKPEGKKSRTEEDNINHLNWNGYYMYQQF
jgi:hypothetical protein